MCELEHTALFPVFKECKDFLLELDGAQDANHPDWIVNCHCSLSGLGDNLVLATPYRLVMMTTRRYRPITREPAMELRIISRWSSSNDMNSLSKPEITAVACIPVAAAPGETAASTGAADWVCVAVGFKSGHLKFYTEGMKLLIEEKLFDESVKQIRVNNNDILTVVSDNNLCNLNGFSLWQSLRGARAQMARGATPVVEPLEVRKYSFTDQESVENAIFISTPNINTFDYLTTVSISSGFHSSYRPSPPSTSQIVTIGRKPFVGFFYTTDTPLQPVLTDVALTVVSKLSSVVPSWLGFGTSNTSGKKSAIVAPPVALKCRFGLCDARRVGLSMSVCPDGTLIAIADSLARVVLVERESGVAIRMWKGVRDAQVAFIESLDLTKRDRRHKSTEKVKRALFLAIYAPKKGLLEIFGLKQGRRVASFSVGSGHLLSSSFGFLGGNQDEIREDRSSVFFLNENGLIRVLVPFDCALIHETDSRIKDNRISSQIKSLLRGKVDGTWEDLNNLIDKLETNEGRLAALKLILPSKFVSHRDLNQLILKFREITNGENLQLLLNFCDNLKRMLDFYQATQDLKQLEIDPENIPDLAEILRIGPQEINCLVKLIEKSTSEDGLSRVKFSDERTAELSTFLSSFNYSENNVIDIITDLSEEKLHSVAVFLYENIFLGSSKKYSKWIEGILLTKIEPFLLVKLLLIFWQQQSFSLKNLSASTYSLVQILYRIIELFPGSECELWWPELRNWLANSKQLKHTLIASFCCRAVYLSKERSDENCDWEKISRETCAWDILVLQLEDAIVLLDDNLTEPMSLSELANKGPGAVAELVAKWCLQFDLEPGSVVNLGDVEFQSKESDIKPIRQKGDVLNEPIIEINFDAYPDLPSCVKERLAMLKARFPYSLTSSALISNIFWEFLQKWQRDLNKINLLEAAMSWLKFVPNIKVKHGLGLMMWSAVLKQHIECAFRLICVTGKVPADRLCLQEIGLTPMQIASLFEVTVHLFVILLDTLTSPDINLSGFPMKEHPLWMELYGPNASPSLATVAYSQPLANEDLLVGHLQVFNCCMLLAKLDLKASRKLVSFWDNETTGLFTPLTSSLKSNNQHLLHAPKHIRDAQQTFLLRAVAACSDLVLLNEAVDGSGTIADPHLATQWFRICIEIALTWQLSIDALRRCFVYELYSGGFDRVAEEVLGTVSDTELLAADLLNIVGMRVKVTLNANGNAVGEQFAALSRALSSWIEDLDEELLKQHNVPSEDTEVLLTWIIQHLPDIHPNYTIATLLLEALPSVFGLL